MPLLRTKESQKQVEVLLKAIQTGEMGLDGAARQLIEMDPQWGFPYVVLGRAAAEANRPDEADALLWQALRLTPCGHACYLVLSGVLREREPGSPMADALVRLAMWKMALSADIPPEVAESFAEMLGGELDFSDPETYRILAVSSEAAKPELFDSPEVQERLLPYILLNDLQQQAGDAVDEDVLRGILDNAKQCVPVLRAAVREWDLNADLLNVEAVALIIALLGEADGAELIGDLLSVDLLHDDILFTHTNWAIWRQGQRHPEEALQIFRSKIPGAGCAMRCALAEHIGMLPETPQSTSALLSLLDGFPTLAADPDAGYLLLSVSFFLMTRQQEGQAEKVLRTHAHLLSKKTRRWFEETIEADDPFIPSLLEAGIADLTIQAVCVEGALMPEEDADEDFDEESEEDDEPVEQYVAPARPGRNDPCWCGSGKKYKKCHLPADEAGGPAGVPSKVLAGTGPDLIQQVIAGISKWITHDDTVAAFRMYFDEEVRDLHEDEGAGFMQWMLYDFRAPSSGRTPVEEFRRRRGPQLGDGDRARVEAWCTARYMLLEIVGVEKGRGVQAKDVFTDESFFVHDVTASKELVQWDCTLSRVEVIDGRHEFSSDGVLIPRAQLGRLRERIEAEASDLGVTPAELVRANSHKWHRVVRQMGEDFAKNLAIRTPEGDPLEFCHATFEVLDQNPLLEALRRVNGFEDATRDDDPLDSYRFAWVDPDGGDAKRSYGSFEIGAAKLRLECMSRKRLELGRQALVARAGQYLKHLGDVFESPQAAMKRLALEKPQANAKTMQLDPEIEQKMKEEHYAGWLDEELPALGGKTARQVVKTAAGRRQVDDLLRMMENGEARSRKEGRAAFDFAPLRRELGLD